MGPGVLRSLHRRRGHLLGRHGEGVVHFDLNGDDLGFSLALLLPQLRRRRLRRRHLHRVPRRYHTVLQLDSQGRLLQAFDSTSLIVQPIVVTGDRNGFTYVLDTYCTAGLLPVAAGAERHFLHCGQRSVERIIPAGAPRLAMLTTLRESSALTPPARRRRKKRSTSASFPSSATPNSGMVCSPSRFVSCGWSKAGDQDWQAHLHRAGHQPNLHPVVEAARSSSRY